MPLTTPKQGEDTKTFMSRCMGDSIMKKEYPEQEQRQAVCHSQFMKKGGAAGGLKMDSKEEVKRDEKGRLIIAENVPVIFNARIEVQQ